MYQRRTALVVLLGLCLAGASHLWAQRANIVIEAMSPHRLEQKGWTSNVSSGLRSVPKGTIVYLSGKDQAGGTVTGYLWEMVARPAGSAAQLDSTNKSWTTFRTDTTGYFTIRLRVTTSAGSHDTTVVIASAKFSGVGGMGSVPPILGQGQCAACHAGQIPSLGDKVTGWKQTGHATKFQRAIDGIDHGYYAQSCVSCHTTGFDAQPTATNNGFDDQQRNTGWTMPATKQRGNWDTLVSRFPQLAQVATIGCENCHGPGSLHIGNIAGTDKSRNVGVCGQCHDEPWRHNRVAQFEGTKHAAPVWSNSFRQTSSSPDFMTNNLNNCIRCHDAQGFINYTRGITTNTTNITGVSAMTCAMCHDVHSNTNAHMLRKVSVDTLANGLAITGTPGHGGICMNCHKSRRNGETYPVVTRIGSTFSPHNNPQTDMWMGKNAHSFGQNIPSSVAHQLVSNSCVGCHMSATPDTGTVARDKIGGHSWKMKYTSGGTQYDNVTKCADCHGAITRFNQIIAAFDYDGDGVIEPFVDELKGLKSLLARALPPFGVDSVAWQLIGSSPDSVRLKKAFYNYKFFDNDGSGGIHNPKYAIGILQRSITTLTGVEFADYSSVPTEFSLSPNYPNPFNPSTTIAFSVPRADRVTLEVYDLLGKLVSTLVAEDLAPGTYRVSWNGKDGNGASVASGVYLYRLQSTSFSQVRKMILVK